MGRIYQWESIWFRIFWNRYKYIHRISTIIRHIAHKWSTNYPFFIRYILRNEGLKGLYRGIVPNFCKGSIAFTLFVELKCTIYPDLHLIFLPLFRSGSIPIDPKKRLKHDSFIYLCRSKFTNWFDMKKGGSGSDSIIIMI